MDKVKYYDVFRDKKSKDVKKQYDKKSFVKSALIHLMINI